MTFAFGNASFMVMTCAYFVCGMQLVFLTTHLPSYLAICGMDPMLSAQTLGVIGGFNVLGSLFFGWAGQRWNKLALLGGVYISRSMVLAWYFMLPAMDSGFGYYDENSTIGLFFGLDNANKRHAALAALGDALVAPVVAHQEQARPRPGPRLEGTESARHPRPARA